MQADGKILAGGNFTSIGGQPRNFFARLSNDTAALQNLAARQTTVTWMRGGSSQQFTRVTFESSTDNVNYTPLGNGTAVGSNWTLTGLSLPLGQDIYIRARGYYRSGYFNASESITESVRNAFITLAPTPAAVVSRKLHGGVPFDINLPLTGTPESNAAVAERPMITRSSLPSPAPLVSTAPLSPQLEDQSAALAAAEQVPHGQPYWYNQRAKNHSHLVQP